MLDKSGFTEMRAETRLPGRLAGAIARRLRGRLYRKFAMLLVALVASALTIVTAFEAYNSYVENRGALVAIQREKAQGAATVIEQFLGEIEGQLGWTTHTVSTAGPSGPEQRRLDFLRLLRQAPAITEVVHIDSDGREQLRVSRLAMDVIGTGVDRSGEAIVREALANRRAVSPVYFRKESEPYLTLAITGASRRGGVIVAEVNLKFIWDVISRIKVGKAGIAYAVDNRGLLIAHPDIGLVLRKTDMSGLDQVKLARVITPGEAQPAIATDRNGREVLTAHAAVEPVGWRVFVEQPLEEAFAPIYASLTRTGLLSLVGLVLAGLAGLWLAQRLVVPIEALAQGAARFGAGELGHRIAVKTGDEVEALAESFNEMGERLKESYTGLERKVEERTRALTETLEQEAATSEILGAIAKSLTDVQPVFDIIAQSALRLCGARWSAVLRYDGEHLHLAAFGNISDTAELGALRGAFPRKLNPNGSTDRAVMQRLPVYIPDISVDPHYPLKELAQTTKYRSTLSLPMLRDGLPLGAITVVGEQANAFAERQIALLQTFADQAVIAIENARLFNEVQARTADLSEALAQQTATADVLKAISRSVFDLPTVLTTLIDTAVRLCKGSRGTIYTIENGVMSAAAFNSHVPATLRAHLELTRYNLDDDRPVSDAAREGRLIHIPDLSKEPRFPYERMSQLAKFGAMLYVPLMRDGAAIGLFAVPRDEPVPFNEREIEILRTFADQAVIAIQNARLFEEVQNKTSDLTEALGQQTAIAGALALINQSVTDLPFVLDALTRSAAQICGADCVALWLVSPRDGNLAIGSHFGYDADFEPVLRAARLRPTLESPYVAARAAALADVVVTGDVRSDPRFNGAPEHAQAGYVSVLAVPLLREGRILGVFGLDANTAEAFGPRQIEIAKTFADQAVIAIENARLFDEVQKRTRELQESLEQQTVTAEVLKVISRSAFDLNTVFNALLTSAGKLCGAETGIVYAREGEFFVAQATFGGSEQYLRVMREYPQREGNPTIAGLVASTRAVVHIPDKLKEPRYRPPPATTAASDTRTLLGVPLLRNGRVEGVFALMRVECKPFTQREIDIVQTFADQAMIAIENARLLEEVQARTRELSRSLAQTQALSEVGQTVSSSLDLQEVLATILRHAGELAQAGGGTVYVIDEDGETLSLAASHNLSETVVQTLRACTMRLVDSPSAQAIVGGQSQQIADLGMQAGNPIFDTLRDVGIRALLGVPLRNQDRTIGILFIGRDEPGAFSAESVSLLEAFASQSAIALNNARLFRELEEKGEQLRIASLHKSQFLANMSHELRTPLNAILGYTELIQDGVYGEVGGKLVGVLDRVQSNGRHLLGLINDVLDLSKIEAGQLTLRLEEYSMPDIVNAVVGATEALATDKKLALAAKIAPDLPIGLGDQQRITQVLLNLVGNAIKFTDRGSVTVSVRARAGKFVLKVADTGPGIPAAEQARIFEEFHQVDSSNTKKKGGTGLGLAISRRIVALHGGRISVESAPGEGSTFRVDLPVRVERQRGV